MSLWYPPEPGFQLPATYGSFLRDPPPQIKIRPDPEPEPLRGRGIQDLHFHLHFKAQLSDYCNLIFNQKETNPEKKKRRETLPEEQAGGVDLVLSR